MGTTLTNGVYLPNEGERNCYAGLKTNWEILDQKVADVTALQQAVAGALHREIVESLPTTDIDPNTIYMILSGTSATENVYNEYMYVNNAWELIGTSATDLTNYYTKSEVDGKLLLKANASDLTSHTGDTTIHVTASDKAKWNNQTYVLRYSSTTLVASSTNSNALLDNTDNLKVGDKVIDSSGVIYSVTAIDTANSTFTIGTSLIDLAQDSDVVHKSGNETIAGVKTFSDNPLVGNGNTNITISNRQIIANGSASTTGNHAYSFMQLQAKITYADSSSPINVTVTLDINEDAYADGKKSSFSPSGNNVTNLGRSGKRWANVYATNYYYGGSEIEFSTKFVTTDTAQTVSGSKTYNDLQIIGYGTQYKGARNAYILPEFGASYSGLSITTLGYAQTLKIGNFVLDANNKPSLDTSKGYIQVATGENNGVNACVLVARNTTSSSLGTSSNKWSIINGLEPSSLSLPSGNSSDRIDISSYISDLSGTINVYTPPANGYLTFTFSNGSQVQIYPTSGMGLCSKWVADSGSGIIRGFIPVLKNTEMKISVNATTMDSFYFIPCQGNV